MKKTTFKKVKSFYFSSSGLSDDEYESSAFNPAKIKAYKLAHKIGGKVRIKYHPSDEGREYVVYKRKKLLKKDWV